ncbi:PAS domain S-box-containing protein/diguanylate cyclase (GGDEF) domain-containing protein [Actinopolyspora xinjiangensis]|uniref:PAS domain S-box-containing protein/diguanylate cyclase (GGDEF) domain-containing protein n=1 Tax=Actinopolyspora xinjiangensis TaxID=405564 RepID=A0A1H0SKM1_9ACTN|nr:diguanylate cyclase [Actinopolyspora xinjiangensis]SDP42321.1 PAS domain S-box-containing protein/diguanylate cyclase (GGDEF) domain-containing protein [Actinopolyspora xinjiangensis]
MWESGRWCAELATRWARWLSRTSYIPMAREALESELHELIELILEGLRDGSGEPERAKSAGHSVGTRLVRLHATGEESLTRSLELLCGTLLPDPSNESARQVLTMLASVASGYADADRGSALEQQETLKRALLWSKLDAERRLRTSEDRFREVFNTTPIGMGICELDGKFVEVNSALERTLGYSERELRSTTVTELFDPAEPEVVTTEYAELLRGERSGLRERRNLVRADGSRAWTYIAASVLRDSEGDPHQIMLMVEDLRELNDLQEQLYYQTLHDSITGLPNRQHFRSRLERALGAFDPNERLTLYQLRLDGFGLINEGLGYEIGDSIVQSVGNRLLGLVAGEDGLVARIGGTEFAVLLRQRPDTPGIAEFAEMINAELDEPIYINGNGLAPTASIGVVQRSVGDSSPTDMLWAAEVALRSAEQAGKRQWAVFDPHRAPIELDEARLAAVMPGALELGEFEIRYRPLVSLTDGEVVAVEARLAWQPEEHARLEHDDCLRLAERSGITLALRDWVLRTAWRQLSEWHAEGLRYRLVVGLSPNQSRDPDLVAGVRRVVEEVDSPDAGWLLLCMSMTALMSTGGEASDNVATLAETGIRTAAHEFRAAPAELRFLRRFPTHAVLLAPDLVQLAAEDETFESPELRALGGMIPLVRSCGIPLAVPDLRTERQARVWREQGCDIGSGPFCSEALSTADMTEFLREGASASEVS